jgi:alpha-mannosidase
MQLQPFCEYSVSLCSLTLYVEAAANGMFGAGKGGLINPPDPAREFPLILAEVAVFDQDVYDLIMDLTVLYDMSKVSNSL